MTDVRWRTYLVNDSSRNQWPRLFYDCCSWNFTKFLKIQNRSNMATIYFIFENLNSWLENRTRNLEGVFVVWRRLTIKNFPKFYPARAVCQRNFWRLLDDNNLTSCCSSEHMCDTRRTIVSFHVPICVWCMSCLHSMWTHLEVQFTVYCFSQFSYIYTFACVDFYKWKKIWLALMRLINLNIVPIVEIGTCLFRTLYNLLLFVVCSVVWHTKTLNGYS